MAQDRGIEKQIRALREAKAARRPRVSNAAIKKSVAAIKAAVDKAESKAAAFIAAQPQETTDMKKPKTKTAEKRKPTAKEKKTKAPKIEAAKKAKAPKKGVPATEVADFICRAGGASMAELEKKFGIEAHPMRAKIFYAKHELGYAIENADGRYTGTAPKQ